jgi:polar amino acid transport system permease protein
MSQDNASPPAPQPQAQPTFNGIFPNWVISNAYTLPYWLVVMLGGWGFVVYQMQRNEDYVDAMNALREGTPVTIWIAIGAYLLALVIGLLIGIVRAYPPQRPETRLQPHKQLREVLKIVLYHTVTVYVEFMRGIPPVVFLLIAGFIIVPEIRDPMLAVIEPVWVPLNNTIIAPTFNVLFNHPQVYEWPIIGALFDTPFVGDFLGSIFREYEQIDSMTWRGRDPATAIVGLGLIYGAFLSEVFRAGIQSVPRGQIEAAKSVGMNYVQTMRFVVVPQAVRMILPPLGNNFISMIKDTSLVTILGTADLTQQARKWSGSAFTYIPTYAVLSMIYLTMTVTGSLLVQAMERNLRKFSKK